ncbi:MAG: family 16 glycosylhydrolase [Chitinophagales bacterium]|nr:family 16 glycosylhydrolase [Chitinophagales bacterium]
MKKSNPLFPVLVSLAALAAVVVLLCKEKNYYKEVLANRTYFDSVLLLRKLPYSYYRVQQLESSFPELQLQNKATIQAHCGAEVSFKPLGHHPDFNLHYTHVYSPSCVYRYADTIYKYAEVAFPNPCLSANKLFAKVDIANKLKHAQTFYLRVFYQNTTYWYNVNTTSDTAEILDNFYGASQVVPITLAAGEKRTAFIPYSIGLDPKNETDDDSQTPARPGNYEFALVVQTDTVASIMQQQTDWKHTNPFAAIRKNNDRNYLDNTAYVGPKHFKFTFLEERFDGTNDTTLGRLYIPFDSSEKRLCDTCTGWFKDIITEDWNHDDFYTGKIAKTPLVRASFGQRKENVSISKNGIRLLIPGSTEAKKQKTWGEIKMGQTFKYGHVTIRAKLAPMIGRGGCPNGIIHNIWLYQQNADPIDTTNPYNYLRDPVWNTQLYEIDFEVWSSTREWQAWDRMCNINYAIIDYMRHKDVLLKPGEERWNGKYSIDRFPQKSANILGEDLSPDWFKRFHTFEVIWEPQKVRMFIDGKETACFTPEYCAIPNKHMFLWIGSPIYQDGTIYTQSYIPFLESDKETIIDYIKIE